MHHHTEKEVCELALLPHPLLEAGNSIEGAKVSMATRGDPAASGHLPRGANTPFRRSGYEGRERDFSTEMQKKASKSQKAH